MWRADSFENSDPDAGKDWGWEEKGTTEDKMVGWHHCLNGHESDEIPGAGDGQGGLVCCSTRGHKESDMTELLNWTEPTYLTPKQESDSPSYLPKDLQLDTF